MKKDNRENYLDEALAEYGNSDFYPFHMPGHKRNFCPEGLKNPYKIDITEIKGFDNLHHAEGILLEAQRRAAALYGAEESFYLVNGSTSGLLAAVSACTSRNGIILMARNCHKAAYHGVYLRGLRAHYLCPPAERSVGLNGSIDPVDVEEQLTAHPEIQAVLITSPTYDGVVSDVERISEIAHSHNVPLIVDEAHGAHFCFSEYFPASALEKGADIVIQSLHKTLPSMTQTALLHVKGGLADRDILRHFLGIYQSSSPSYVFMAGMEACVRLMKKEGQELFRKYIINLEKCREELGKLKNIRLITAEELTGTGCVYDVDKSRLILTVPWTNGRCAGGKRLEEILYEKYHIQLEMAAPGYALALTSVMDTKEGFSRLEEALREADELPEFAGAAGQQKGRRLEFEEICGGLFFAETSGGLPVTESPGRKNTPGHEKYNLQSPMFVAEAMEAPAVILPIEESVGKISAEFAYLYPPGIPMIVPGEEITGHFVQNVRRYMEKGLDLQGLSDKTNRTIRVVKE